MIRFAWLIVAGLLSAATAFGQTTAVVNPTVVQFSPSADNSAVTADGLPVVLRYDLQIYVQSTTAPYTTVNLGKPAVGSDGTISVNFSALMSNWPLPDGTYDARVVAIGQSGVGQSDVSNVFTFQSGTPVPPPTCTYSLSATHQIFPRRKPARSRTLPSIRSARISCVIPKVRNCCRSSMDTPTALSNRVLARAC